MHPFQRTELIVGTKGWARLQRASVLVVGLGGVGSYAAEALARSGIGRLGLVDFDAVCVTNLNRQIHAFRRTVGLPKAELMAKRVQAINPKCTIDARTEFYEASTSEAILEPGWDWIIDCIDNVTAKIHLLETAARRDIPIVSAMGAGSKLDPTRVKVNRLRHTKNDPLARVIRKQLGRRGVRDGIIAVWSDELPVEFYNDVSAAFRCICPGGANEHHSCEDRNVVQGTVSFMPSLFGLMASGVVINDIIGRPLIERVPHVDRVTPAAAAPAHAK